MSYYSQQPDPGQWNPQGYAPPPMPPQQKKSKVPLIIGIVIAVIFIFVVLPCAGIFGFMIYIGEKGPETFAVQGHEIKPGAVATIKELQLTGEGETIIWFYSDALVDVADGMYFFTDRKLVLYSKDWDPTTFSIPLREIVDVVHDTEGSSIMTDSTVWIATEDGSEYSFPVSVEKGNDQKFLKDLQERIDAARAAAGLE